MDRATFTSEILKRSKDNPNTSDSYKIILTIAGKLKHYKERDLFKEPETKAKWIVSQMDFLESIIGAFIALLQYCFSLERELQNREDCISQLHHQNQQLQLDNHFLKEHLNQAIDGYLLIHTKHTALRDIKLYNSLKDSAA